MPIAQQPHGHLRSFGRIQARPLKPRQAALFDTLLPSIAVPEGAFDPRALAPEAKEVWLEIGFGGGEHMAGQAARNPEALVIGAEPFVNGVGSALRHVEEQGLKNVRLHHGDVRDIIAGLPDQSLDRVFIMFPDPWQKARHHKRRLIQDDFLAELGRVMKPGARLRFATDWANYADWALEKILACGLFAWPAERADDWRIAPADHLTTRYEEKKLGDCAPVFLDFVRA
ncbi:tRNA (guanosine(46)-N7)-methyltransferase TrmB [Caulobacter segnis]|uniref:tRNA (guanosine(46)-N7)-methyltransferase TrmB n=1 Tax=Caulobacter segnis TaxID=88688 RepID=UPI00240F313E|nr:tRNA (guanosine(46)-N7)-methyltransferase TrmB [Caulobacter segnis]MDG2521503.1 tRNA (guanosine(46)-N7)-methyltransferase TrmB [Caulobacter segnis]